MTTVEPLKKRTMTLPELQKRTVKVLKMIRTHLEDANTSPHTDGEIIDDLIEPLLTDIRQDRAMLKMLAKK